MSKLVVIFTLFFTTLFSNQEPESFPFFGLSGSHNQISFSKASALPREKEIFPGLRYGEQTLDWRTMFTLSGKKEMYEASLEIDKILLDDIFGYPEVRPYLGASVGYLHYDNINMDKKNGYYFGGAFGFLIYVTDNIDLDISYHYNEVKDIDFLETLKGPSVGIHYFY
jgi:opacity protein-like surface antigen